MTKSLGEQDPNDIAVDILKRTEPSTYADGKQTRKLLSSSLEIQIEPNGDRYSKISGQLDSLRTDLEDYLKTHYQKTVQEERSRTVKEMVPRSGLISKAYRTLFGKELEYEVRKTIVDLVEVPVPTTDGSPQALQQLITESADGLERYNSEIVVSVQEIDRVISEMRMLKKEWLHEFLNQQQSFKALDKNVLHYEAVLSSLYQKLVGMSISDDDFEETMNNYEDFENMLVQNKHKLRDHHVRSILALNQKNGLRFYELCLDTTRNSAQRMVDYITPFVSIVRQLNITTDNVDKVCHYVGRSLDVAQGTVGLMKKGTEYLAGMVGAVQQVQENGPTALVETKPHEQKIEQHRKQLDSELDGYRQEQEELDMMAKQYLLEGKDGSHDTYKEDLIPDKKEKP